MEPGPPPALARGPAPFRADKSAATPARSPPSRTPPLALPSSPGTRPAPPRPRPAGPGGGNADGARWSNGRS